MKKNDTKTSEENIIAEDMIMLEEEQNSGAIRISENVIASVVKKYTLEVPGVIRFVNSGFVGGLVEMIGRKSHENSVVIDIEEENVNITVTITMEFGTIIPETAALVQDIIRTKVEELTGKQVTKVDVIIQNLEDIPEEKPKKTTKDDE